MDNPLILERINSFSRWHYEFNLKGYMTPIHDKKRINRHQQRIHYFFDPLVHLLGGSLAGKRVLDLGCNAGFWSLQAVENGCDFVLGIDGRQMHIDQANFVFDVHEIPRRRYEFIQADVGKVDLNTYRSFDVVFCLGLMYHINKPIELIERISQVNSDLLIIDTQLSMASGSYLEIAHESLDDPRNAIDSELILRPTRQAVCEIVKQFGYASRILKPQFNDYTGARAYKTGKRRAFLCAKRTDLSTIPVSDLFESALKQ